MTSNTPETQARDLAQFFFEMGFGACYAEAIVRNGNQVPFPLSDAEIERQWAISQEAYDDADELEAMLSLARHRQSSSNAGGASATRVRGYLAEEASARERLATFPDAVRQRLINWQEGQSEWFSNTLLEVVAEFIAFDDAALASLSTPTAEPTPTPDRIGKDAVREALERISKLTPFSANAATAEDFAATVHAIADTALTDTKGDRPMGDR